MKIFTIFEFFFLGPIFLEIERIKMFHVEHRQVVEGQAISCFLTFFNIFIITSFSTNYTFFEFSKSSIFNLFPYDFFLDFPNYQHLGFSFISCCVLAARRHSSRCLMLIKFTEYSPSSFEFTSFMADSRDLTSDFRDVFMFVFF